jgi:NAD(P)H-dependent flavin oxidoreductase YrpB (nitropropane dioxygenase family)
MSLVREFDLDVPIVQGAMGGGISGPRLVGAVAEAGALAMLPIWPLPLDEALGLIAETRAITDRAFAVNIRADLAQHDHIAAAIDRGVTIVHTFWGDPTDSMRTIRNGGARLIATVWDADSAKAALDAGASAVIAQGVEAGGHVMGTTPLAELIQTVTALAGSVPVVAAGGLADGADAARVLQSGAAAALFGTRFAATEESDAHPSYKQALVKAGPGDTVRSECFDILWPDAPHRTLKNSTFIAWDRAGRPQPGTRPGENDVILRAPNREPVPRYSAEPPSADTTGDWEAAALYAGTGVGKITDVPPAAEIIARIMAELNALRGGATDP